MTRTLQSSKGCCSKQEETNTRENENGTSLATLFQRIPLAKVIAIAQKHPHLSREDVYQSHHKQNETICLIQVVLTPV